jgi:hypothetical protein
MDQFSATEKATSATTLTACARSSALADSAGLANDDYHRYDSVQVSGPA